MAVSLRILLTVMIVIMSLVAALIAFLPTYLSGVDAVDSTISDIRSSFLVRVNSSIDTYLSFPLQQLDQVHNFFKSNTYTGNETANIRMLLEFATKNKDSVSASSIYLSPNAGSAYVYVDAGLSPVYPVVGQMQIFSNGTSYITAYGVSNIDTLEHVDTPFNGRFDASYELVGQQQSQLSIFNPRLAAVSSPRIGYHAVSGALDQPALVSYAELVSPGGESIGFTTCDSKIQEFNRLLSTLGLRERSSAVAYTIYPVKAILGNSWGESVYELSPFYLDFSLPIEDRLLRKYFNNISSGGYVTNEVVPEVGLAQLESSSFPFSSIVNTKEHGRTFVDIIGVEQPGLSVRVLLTMPEVDFMEGINKSRTAALAGTFSAIAITIVIAFLLAHLITAPLVRLHDRMQLAARFQDDGTADDTKSLMSEVAFLQSGYEEMRDELNKAKPYLPQSVLQRCGDEDDEEEDLEESYLRANDSMGSGFSKPSAGGGSSSLHRSKSSTSYASSQYTKTSDNMSRRSGTSSKMLRSAAAGAGGGLNTANSAVPKRVSILVFNLRNFHDKASHASQMINLQKKQLTVVSRHVKENRGVIDFFQGDHIQCSFNAVSNCNLHQRRALTAALAVVHELEQDVHCPGVTVGVSSGMAVVGNMGNDEMRRFCIVGHVVQQANLLERLNKNYDTKILAADSMIADVENEFVLRCVDICRIPRPRTEAPVTISEVLSAANQGEMDEWMYELEKGEENNPFIKVNEAFRHLLDGEKSVATTKLAEAEEALKRREAAQSAKESSGSNGRRTSYVGAVSTKKLFDDSVGRVGEILERLEGNPAADLHKPLGWIDKAFF